jgi:perosamine synthetase
MNVVYGGTAAQMIKDKVPDLTVRKICKKAIENDAESLGSLYKNKHTGIFGQLGTLIFNGNKIITTGGGSCIVTNNKLFAEKAEHLTSKAKVSLKWISIMI